MKLDVGDVFKLPADTKVGIQHSPDDNGFTGRKVLTRETWYIVTDNQRSQSGYGREITASELHSNEYSESAPVIQFHQGGQGGLQINNPVPTERRKRVLQFVKEN